MSALTPEIIRAEFIEKKGTFTAVADKLSVPTEELESYCFSLCKQYPDEFNYGSFLTKSWFEEKLSEYDSLVDIANHTGIHYRTLCHFKNKVLPNKRRDLSLEISRDDLWRLYVQQELSDKAIAAMYNTNVSKIKYLRQSYDIISADRKPLCEKLPIELFYRLYVVSRLGLGQIGALYNTSRATVANLKERYAAEQHPLSKEIADTTNTGSYPRFLEELFQIASKEELIHELRTKTVFEVAAQHNLIAPTVNSLTPFSKEWLEAELLTKNVATIAAENNMTRSRVSVLVSEYGLESSVRHEKVTKKLLQELYINRCWSDAKIAKHLGIAAGTVKRIRLEHKMFSNQRPTVEERIPPKLFKYLYIDEKMSLLQIGAAFDIADSKIRQLRQKYIADGYPEFAHRTSVRISKERLEYLYKQIHLNLLP